MTSDRGPNRAVEALRGRLIVSCQAYPGEPMRDPQTMTRIAQACVAGGAAGIRAQGIDDLRAIRPRVDVPLIGLWKDGDADVFITPTLEHAIEVAETGADIVAIDGTRRTRPDHRSLSDVVAGLHERFPRLLVMADCGSAGDARAAEAAGVDLIGTTLAGYTGERHKTEGPDLDLVAEIAAIATVPVIVEGRVHTLVHAAQAMAAGGFAVCVGTAITHPTTITGWFRQAVEAAPTALDDHSAVETLQEP